MKSPIVSRFIIGLLTAVLTVLSASHVSAANLEYSNCLLAASKNQLVSLGTPMPLERLSHKTNMRIGVLPFYFNNGEVKKLSEQEKSNYI